MGSGNNTGASGSHIFRLSLLSFSKNSSILSFNSSTLFSNSSGQTHYNLDKDPLLGRPIQKRESDDDKLSAIPRVASQRNSSQIYLEEFCLILPAQLTHSIDASLSETGRSVIAHEISLQFPRRISESFTGIRDKCPDA